ncbi:MAG: type II toxin-antitoxin system HicA family toxin [ANME-2 cluster archaeon]|nr:type II toxin-antitoxin system HicA family toxin [ANME-2 cluster archaeon]MBC2701157.1 type II toxin-antitoxin system HicA family toxin [ANME-2 cluster archaeon]MBC2707251.1 type II toxin-antitoxin system HicA family toxin [ANME-2 cluster archaeon]MBC2746598.1 type II toxin-antitoxin system HicA family toxin [ANME-2 cluster archaeon]MBC2764290.1 type II toxin-antitoxin system HicA family toxin [ANME-2 cluster archaeon]
MPKLTPVSWNVLVKRLNKLGFEGPYSGGKHPFMVKNDLVLTIPNPHKAEISVDLLSRILRQAKISREEWLNN